MATTAAARKKSVRCFIRTKPTTTFPEDVMSIQADGKGVAMRLRRREAAGAVNNQPEHFAFAFDKVLHEATQQTVYDEAAADVVTGALEGFNGTVMCYGQTGAGKTFTMTGSGESFEHRGVVPRAVMHLFREIRARPETAFVVKVSYIEIYNEAMYDLLNPNGDIDLSTAEEGTTGTGTGGGEPGLKIVEDSTGSTQVRGARLELVNTEEEALHCLFDGEMNRTIAEHQLNKRSSRSHCVFTMHLDMRSRVESVERIVTSKVHFVDLAGSERLAKTGTDGATMKEAMYINKSLTFLEQVIIALADKRREHVPYRQSRLTNLLKDSLGGNCRTTLIANVRCEPQHAEETIATLRFASRMMLVSNNAVVNVQYDPV
jgi:kinesin family protein 6/9